MESRAFDRSHFYSPEQQALAYSGRNELMRYLCDYDFKARKVRESKTYDRTVGGIRAEPRKCSWCRQPTTFTTPRGRSVHPACEGWVDELTPRALMRVVALAFPGSTVLSMDMEESE